ncbi:hypothetical protein AgCh_025577 [Apium graveolens]
MPKINQPEEVCNDCLMSKQTRKQFPSKASNNVIKVLQLIHEDLCGPFLLETASGPERKVRVVITDWGCEFGSNEFKKFYEKDGLTRHYTAPYTPQQNGVMERRNQTVVEMAKICLKEMKLHSFMWGEVVRHSVYLLNKLPMRALSGITPYEAWNEKKLQVGYIRVFGSISYMRIPSQKMSKLDDRSKSVVNLGKELGTKAYCLYDPSSNKVFVSRDIIFKENNSWSWETNDVSEASMFIIEGMAEVPGIVQFNSGGDGGGRMPEKRQGVGKGNRFVVRPYNGQVRPMCALDPVVRAVLCALLGLRRNQLVPRIPSPARELGVKVDRAKLVGVCVCGPQTSDPALEGATKVRGLKWIFKLKKDVEGRFVKHKARLVPKGYIQERVVDFDEVFAPVTRPEMVHFLLALAAKNELEVHHLDVPETKVRCEEDLVEAIETTMGKKDCLCFIEVICHEDDTSKELLEWGSRVSAAHRRPPNRK